MNKKEQHKQAVQALRRIVKPNTTIVVVQKSVSSSGMNRRLELYAIKNNRLVWITSYIADVLDWPRNDKGLLVTGCGMDMHFHTIYTLSSYLYPRKAKNRTLPSNGGTNLSHQSL